MRESGRGAYSARDGMSEEFDQLSSDFVAFFDSLEFFGHQTTRFLREVW